MGRMFCEKHGVHYDAADGCPICVEEKGSETKLEKDIVKPIRHGLALVKSTTKKVVAKTKGKRRRKAA